MILVYWCGGKAAAPVDQIDYGKLRRSQRGGVEDPPSTFFVFSKRQLRCRFEN
jgi:hypothetical protein